MRKLKDSEQAGYPTGNFEKQHRPGLPERLRNRWSGRPLPAASQCAMLAVS